MGNQALEEYAQAKHVDEKNWETIPQTALEKDLSGVKGKSESGKGTWYNAEKGEKLHPDLRHLLP